jgi:uncharacterized protein YndB with AHSA1/START domain
MDAQAANHSTFSLERTYKAAPERVFAAFADPVQKRRWFVEGEGWTIESYELDFRVGGFERSRFRFKDGAAMTNDTVYHDIVENRRIIVSYDMTMGGQRISVSLSTIELEPAGQGTRLRYTEQAAFLEGGDGAQMREQGWRELFQNLANEVDSDA